MPTETSPLEPCHIAAAVLTATIHTKTTREIYDAITAMRNALFLLKAVSLVKLDVIYTMLQVLEQKVRPMFELERPLLAEVAVCIERQLRIVEEGMKQ
jgi:hypothetical protein